MINFLEVTKIALTAVLVDSKGDWIAALSDGVADRIVIVTDSIEAFLKIVSAMNE